jgi:hypothetical protein
LTTIGRHARNRPRSAIIWPMKPWSTELRGRFEEHTFTSTVLRGNPLGDPSDRPLWV